MSANVCDVPEIKTDDIFKIIPVNGTPPGQIQTLVTHQNIVSIPKTPPKPIKQVNKNSRIEMGNQQGSDSGKNNSKKKTQTKRGSKKSADKSDSSPQKGKTPPACKDAPPSPNQIGSHKIPVEHGTGASVLETSTTSDVFSEAVDHIDASVQNVLTKRQESSSGDNISHQSFTTPLSTPQVHRAQQMSPAGNPVDRVDELGKSIQKTIIERFSSNSPEPLVTKPPCAHEITGLPQTPVNKAKINEEKSETNRTACIESQAQTVTNCATQDISQRVNQDKEIPVEASSVTSNEIIPVPGGTTHKTETGNISDQKQLDESQSISKESVTEAKCSEGLTDDITKLPCAVSISETESPKISTADDNKSGEQSNLVEYMSDKQDIVTDTTSVQPIAEELPSNAGGSDASLMRSDGFSNDEVLPKSAVKEFGDTWNEISNDSDVSTLTVGKSVQVKQTTLHGGLESFEHDALNNTSDVSSNGESFDTSKSELTALFISETDIAKSQELQIESTEADKSLPATDVKPVEPDGDDLNSATTSSQLPKQRISENGNESATDKKSKCRKSFTNDPLVDNLLLLIKQTLEADDNDYPSETLASLNTDHIKQGDPNQTSEKRAELDNVVCDTEGSMFLSADADDDKTLTPDDMNTFKMLKERANQDSDIIGNVDDDTLTAEDLAEFNRIKKKVFNVDTGKDNQTDIDDEFSYSSMDKFDLSSGETTEDSVIERPVKKVSVLAATQEEEFRQNPSTGNPTTPMVSQIEDVPVLVNMETSHDTQSCDPSNPGESHTEVRQRSLTEEEIRREIRKFMIPEMKEALPKTGSMNRMLDDLHDITPTSDNFPDIEDGDGATSPGYGNGSGLRSRTSITSSELDISEHRDDVSTDSMYADDEDDSSSEVLFCKTYTEPERGTEVLVSCTVVNSALKKETCSSDEFWAESSAAEDAYQQVEHAADAVNKHFTHARSQMQDIQHHLQALRHQMQHMEKQVVKTYNIPSTDEYDFEEAERRAITD